MIRQGVHKAIAGRQTGGKGRRGRGFTSPAGVGIFMTLILKPEFLPTKDFSSLYIAVYSSHGNFTGYYPAYLSVFFNYQTNLKAMIKWPNDIVVNGKKICGILTEMSSEMEAINYIITGIGINVNNEQFPSDIADKATSIKLEPSLSMDFATAS